MTSGKSTTLAILIDLDYWGRICDFSIECQENVEICDKADPTKTKVGISLDKCKTLTKSVNCSNCSTALQFNMIVRTAKNRRKGRNKRKAENSIITTTKLSKQQDIEDFEMFTFDHDDGIIAEASDVNAVLEPSTSRDQIPQMIQEEIIVETLDFPVVQTTKTSNVLALVYQCQICKQCFESTKQWQEHHRLAHGKSTVTESTYDLEKPSSLNLYDTDSQSEANQIELVPAYVHDQVTVYTFKKCNACAEPLNTNIVEHLKCCRESSELVNYTNWYFCGECGFQTQIKETATAHVTTEHLTKTISCESCSELFATTDALEVHVLQKHPTNDPNKLY